MSSYEIKEEDLQLLANMILLIDNEEECKNFFKDLLSTAELESITQRVKIAHMLQNGKKYSEITEETKASTTTISRVNKVLSQDNNMFYYMLKKLKRKEQK
ncbi:MAG: YerC/YecD family TrpR-related protein [Lachnospirales bacterium]